MAKDIIKSNEEKDEVEKDINVSELSVFEKLQKCRVELQQMNLKKSGVNKFAGFNYYELADFLPTTNKLFLKYRLHSRFYIKEEIAYLIIKNLDNLEQEEIFESPIAEANIKGCTPIQSLGGIHTYMKRYLYINALEIVESDLFDGKTGDMEIEKSKPMTIEQKELLNSLNVDERKKIIAKYGTTELTFKQASEALKNIKGV